MIDISQQFHRRAKIAEKNQKKLKLKKIFLSESFIEKVFFFDITFIVSGILVPIILQHLQAKKSENERILTAQIDLLNNISKTIMTYETLALEVSWHKSHIDIYNPQLQNKAYDIYASRVVDLFAEWRVEINKLHTLASDSIAKKLTDFHIKVLLEQDMELVQMQNRDASIKEWKVRHDKDEEMLAIANMLTRQLALDMGIKR